MIVASQFAWLLDSKFDSIGFYILNYAPLTKTFSMLIDIPFVGFTKFNNTIVMGSFIFSLIIYIPCFIFGIAFVKLWRKYVSSLFAHTPIAKAIASFGGIAALVGGLFFGFVKGKIGYNVGWLSLVLNIVGFAIMGTTTTVPMWYIGITIAKVGFCWWMPYINFLVNDGTNESNSALATSLGFVGNSLGAFIFGYVFAFIGGQFGGLSQHQGFLYGGVWMAIALVLIVVNHVKNYNHYKEIA